MTFTTRQPLLHTPLLEVPFCTAFERRIGVVIRSLRTKGESAGPLLGLRLSVQPYDRLTVPQRLGG